MGLGDTYKFARCNHRFLRINRENKKGCHLFGHTTGVCGAVNKVIKQPENMCKEINELFPECSM